MDVKAERDTTKSSLIRSGTFRIGTTSGILPFKVRRLTGSDNCEAKALKDDDRIHVDELHRSIRRKEVNSFLGKNTERRDIFIESLEWNLKSTMTDVNMVHLSIPTDFNIKPEMIDPLVDILYYTKNNNLVLPPFGSNLSLLKRRDLLLTAIRERGEISPRKEIVGLLPSKLMHTELEIFIQEYLDMGVKTFALDLNGGNIPPGLLGLINARLDLELDGKYILMVLGQRDIPRDTTGQVAMANDVASVPLGYDGYAPNRLGFGGDEPEECGLNKEEERRYKALRIKDEKGRKRLFLPTEWGRAQVAAILDEAPELVSSGADNEYTTMTSKKWDIIHLFDDNDIPSNVFGDILRCHDAELVERELEDAGQSALEGSIMEIIRNRRWALPIISRIENERKEYNRAIRTHSNQTRIA